MHEELLELARKVGAEAAALLMDRPPAFEIEEKTTAIDIVTQMDKKAETFIVQSILAKRPDDGMIGEEGAAIESTSGITWVIDPLDGTKGYLRGGQFAIAIALVVDGQPTVGVLGLPRLSAVGNGTDPVTGGAGVLAAAVTGGGAVQTPIDHWAPARIDAYQWSMGDPLRLAGSVERGTFTRLRRSGSFINCTCSGVSGSHWSFFTSATISMYGLSPSSSNHSAT